MGTSRSLQDTPLLATLVASVFESCRARQLPSAVASTPIHDLTVDQKDLLSMPTLNTLFETFLRERTYLKNVSPKTRIWYESA